MVRPGANCVRPSTPDATDDVRNQKSPMGGPIGLDRVGVSGSVARPLRLEAVAAVDRLAAGRAERDLGLPAAVRARRREHLARCPVLPAATGVAAARVATAVAACCLARCAALGTTARLAELAVGEELLLARREREFLAAIGTGQGL